MSSDQIQHRKRNILHPGTELFLQTPPLFLHRRTEITGLYELPYENVLTLNKPEKIQKKHDTIIQFCHGPYSETLTVTTIRSKKHLILMWHLIPIHNPLIEQHFIC